MLFFVLFFRAKVMFYVESNLFVYENSTVQSFRATTRGALPRRVYSKLSQKEVRYFHDGCRQHSSTKRESKKAAGFSKTPTGQILKARL
jgi:myosin heavy subunit